PHKPPPGQKRPKEGDTDETSEGSRLDAKTAPQGVIIASEVQHWPAITLPDRVHDHRNRCSRSTGIGVHHRLERVFTIDWNWCSRSDGTRISSAATRPIWMPLAAVRATMPVPQATSKTRSPDF